MCIEICTWLIKILWLSMFSSSFLPFFTVLTTPLPYGRYFRRGWTDPARILNLDFLTSSYFTRPTPSDELFFGRTRGRTTSENFSHDNSTQKEGLLSLASSSPTTPPSNTLLNDNIHLSLIHLQMINVDRYPKRVLSEVWRGYIFQSCICKYVRSKACCNYLGTP